MADLHGGRRARRCRTPADGREAAYEQRLPDHGRPRRGGPSDRGAAARAAGRRGDAPGGRGADAPAQPPGRARGHPARAGGARVAGHTTRLPAGRHRARRVGNDAGGREGGPMPASGKRSPQVEQQAQEHAAKAREKMDEKRAAQSGGVSGWISDRAGQWDLGGMDHEALEKQQPFWDFLMDRWFRMEMEGWEHLPESPVLLIGIHSGAPFVWDAWTVGLQWWRRFG